MQTTEQKREYHAAYYAAHRDQRRAADALYRAAHKEQFREYCKKYRDAHKEQRRATLADQHRIVRDMKVIEGCQLCGYRRCGAALDYHHLDPARKVKTPSHIVHGSMERFLDELDMCVLLCATCHREVHAGIRTIDAQ